MVGRFINITIDFQLLKMHIHKLLEKAKFAKQKTVAYHGTSLKNLHSILKNGLLMNHGDDGLGRGDYSDLAFTLDPHEGVYVTDKFVKAKNFAKNVDSSQPLVVVLEVQKKSINLDEDEILSILGINENEILSIANKVQDKLHTLDEDKLESYIHQTVDNLYNFAISSTKNRLLKHYDVNPTTVKKIVEVSSQIIYSLLEELIYANIELREAVIRREQEQLLKLFKHVVRGDSDKMDTFQIPANVGFRGANKIIGLVNPESGKAWISSNAGKNPLGRDYTLVNNPRDIL